MFREFRYSPVYSSLRITPTVVCILYSVFCVLIFSACATAPRIENLKKAEARYKLGISYITKAQINEAFIEFQKAIKLNPKDKKSLNYLGLISTEYKKYDEAISYYKRAITIDPDYSDAMNNLGVTYVRMKRWDEAINWFKKVLRNPLYASPEKAYSNIGFAYYKKEDYLNAIDALKEALTRHPDFPQAIYILGIVHIGLGDDEAAIQEFMQAIDIAPNYIEAHWELANAYLRTGERDKAVEHFRIVAEKSKSATMVQEALEYIELLE